MTSSYNNEYWMNLIKGPRLKAREGGLFLELKQIRIVDRRLKGRQQYIYHFHKK